MDAPVLGLLSAVVLLFGSGCLEAGASDTMILLLHYDLEARKEGLGAAPGLHCASASVRDGTLYIYARALQEVGSNRMVFIDPHAEGGIAPLEGEPYVSSFPALVDARIEGHPGSWTQIGMDHRGTVRVDGKVVALPHQWWAMGEDGDWYIDATLSAGPQRVQVVPDPGCD